MLIFVIFTKRETIFPSVPLTPGKYAAIGEKQFTFFPLNDTMYVNMHAKEGHCEILSAAI